MQLVGVSSLVFLAVQGSVQALQSAITCTTTADCAWGETCVAGDSDTVVQACVPPTVCGGSSMGNCPSDDESGKLACLWRPYNDCSEGCAILNGNKGIYKCVSLKRCDAYYGGASCSDGCSVNGVRCNGQGSCNQMGTNADGTPKFGCTCNNGYTGEKCETAPGSKATNSSSTDDDDDEPFFGSLDDGSSDNDNNSQDTSDDASQDNASKDSSTYESGDSSTDTADDSNSDEDASASSSSSASSEAEATSNSTTTTSRSGIRPGVLILVLVMTAFFLIGTVLLVAYSRRRKRQEEELYANALASTQGVGAVGARDLADGHTGRTPRAHIQTM